MQDERFKYGELSEIEERYLNEGYPSLYSLKVTIPDPEFVLYLKEKSNFKIGAYSLDGFTNNYIMESLCFRGKLCSESEAVSFCEQNQFTLIVEDQIYPDLSAQYKYLLLN